MSKKSMLIYGWFGHENLGDELILKSIMDMVISSNDNIELNIMGSKPRSIEKYHKGAMTISTNVDSNPISILRTFKYNPYKVMKNLIKNDALIIGSGGALSDWNPASTTTIFFMINLFKKMNKPIMIIGAGAGPIIKPESKDTFKKILSKVDFITLRDKESYDLLKEIGLNNIHLTNDVVFDLKDKFKISTINNGNCVGIVIAPLIFKSKEKSNKYKNEIVLYIKGLKERKIKVKLIPFQYEYDINFLREIQQEVDVEIYESGKMNMWSIIDELNKCDLIVGMRYHSVVLSLILNKAVLPIVYHSKVNSCVSKFLLEDITQHIGDGGNWKRSDINYQKMLKDTENILKNLESIKRTQKDILDGEILNSNQTILSKFIEKV